MLDIRGLPSLQTSKGSNASATLSSNSITSISSSAIDSATAISSNTLVSTFTTPIITQPMAADNPYISHDKRSSGTVFIAVGCILGVIFFGGLVWYLYEAYRSRKHALYSNIDNSFHSDVFRSNKDMPTYQDVENYNQEFQNPLQDINTSRLSLVDESYDLNDFDQTTVYTEQTAYDPTKPQTNYNAARSMFISPTMEVIEQNRRSRLMKNDLNSSMVSIEPPSIDTNYIRPERSASPERRPRSPIRHHNRNNSSISISPVKTTFTPKKNILSKQTPSSYMDEMFGDE